MKSLFEDSFARVWHDGSSPIVFIRFTKIPDKKNFIQPTKVTLNFVKQLLRANKRVYALIDLSEFVITCPKIDEQLNQWLSQLHTRCGVAFTAVINPEKEKVAKEPRPSADGDHVSWFSCFEKALRNINTHMTMNLLII